MNAYAYETDWLAAQRAYEAYVKSSDGVSLISGRTLPVWWAQSSLIREAWRAAAIAARGVKADAQ